MWANPTVYPSIPVHVRTIGTATSVRVKIGSGSMVDAVDDDGDGEWIATVPIDGLTLDDHTVLATAADDASSFNATATIRLGQQGIKFTDFVSDGPSATPRLHHLDDGAMYVTWGRRPAGGGDGRGLVQALDGRGEASSSPIPITPAGAGDVIDARAAMSDDAIAVLYQTPGTPYANWVWVTDLSGAELMAPVGLDSSGQGGSLGGDILYDPAGDRFVLAFRASAGSADSDVYWMSITGDGSASVGPVSVASAGDGSPVGGFQLDASVQVAVAGGKSVVTFRRDEYNNLLTIDVPKSQAVVVDDQGAVSHAHYMDGKADFWWHWDAGVGAVDGELWTVWCADDLNDGTTPIPTSIRMSPLDPAQPGTLTAGSDVTQAPDYRTNPHLIDVDPGAAVLLWEDNRTFQSGGGGNIQLYAGLLGEDGAALDEVAFTHARFIQEASDFHGVAAGSNAFVTWIDERTGQGILDPRPEVYFETVWH